MRTIKVNENDLKKALELSALVGRLDELDRQKGSIKTTAIMARRAILERQIEGLLEKRNRKDDDAEQNIQIQITLTQEELRNAKEKNISFNDIFNKVTRKSSRRVSEESELFDILSSVIEERPEIFQYVVKR